MLGRELPPDVQVQLLRFLQSGEVLRVGATESVHVKARIVGATNVDIDAARAQMEEWLDTKGELPQRLGDRIGTLVGARPGEVVATDSTSINLFKVLSAALSIAHVDALSRRTIVSERSKTVQPLVWLSLFIGLVGIVLIIFFTGQPQAPERGNAASPAHPVPAILLAGAHPGLVTRNSIVRGSWQSIQATGCSTSSTTGIGVRSPTCPRRGGSPSTRPRTRR